ncbi:MAG: prepilin-type N-terminal cleavage/methylation domain-containing protein [Phycisphaeraceae bacterium]|nr:prepilin-type N-terminal cleavage/methylation domain-containing protein [Phycisphaeraceae bacterium]
MSRSGTLGAREYQNPRRAGRAARRVRGRRGFTLIETALTTVIVGVGVLALIESQQAFMKSNDWSTHAATAAYLANEIREMTRKLPKHDPVTGLTIQTSGGNSVVVGWGPEPGEVRVQDFDDIDDFDGMTFRPGGTLLVSDGDLPGPVDAFGNVIPQILNDGTVVLDGEGNPAPLQGWSQIVRVEKVDPFNFSTVRPHGYEVAPNLPDFEGLRVDQFPLQVTVIVQYQGPFDAAPQTVATVVWVVP